LNPKKVKMKKTILSLFAIIIFANTNAQNLDFENWNTFGGTTMQQPTGWLSSDSLFFGLLGAQLPSSPLVTQSTSAQHGNFSALMEVKFDLLLQSALGGGIIYGSLDTGANIISVPFVGRPSSVSGFYKFTKMGNDSATISFMQSNMDTSADFNIGTNAATWTAFNIPVTYNTSTVPDSINISAGISSNVVTVGSKFWLDNLTLNYPSGLKELLVKNKLITVYPNPASTNISFELKNYNNLSFQILDCKGNIISTHNNLSNTNSIAIAELANGAYSYLLIDQSKKQILDRGIFTKN
jgi:Secretion system C-terminal sorting domain